MPESAGSVPRGVDFVAVQESESFSQLRRTHRSFVFPLAIISLVFYLVFVLLAAYLPDLMATPVFGHVNVGLLLGLAQFVWTFVVTGWYVWYANRRLDPRSAAIREELEREEAGA